MTTIFFTSGKSIVVEENPSEVWAAIHPVVNYTQHIKTTTLKTGFITLNKAFEKGNKAVYIQVKDIIYFLGYIND